MNEFRADLLDVWFVSDDGAFALVVLRDGDGLLVRAYRGGAPDGGSPPLRRANAEPCGERRGAFRPPTSSTTEFAPDRLGVLTLSAQTNYDNSVFLMFGGPPPAGTDHGFAWVALRPEVPVSEVAVFPYYRGSYMDLLTGDDWLLDYDDPQFWYSPQRVYRPALD